MTRYSRHAGFTLLEVILAPALLLALMGLAVGAYLASLDTIRQDESVHRVMSLLRSARADAAITGRRIRVTFSSSSRAPLVEIERDPLGEPNVFLPHQAWWVTSSVLEGDVAVTACRVGPLTEASAEGQSGNNFQSSALDPVMFSPDGSSDSARIELSRPMGDRPWAVEITLNGADGAIASRRLETDELGP